MRCRRTTLPESGAPVLTLWDAALSPPPRAGLTYCWTGYHDDGDTRSLLRYVESNAERIRARYMEWTRVLGESRVNGVRLKDAFPQPGRLGYWWMTPFVEQSPWKSPWMIDVVRLLAFEEIVAATAPAALRLVSDDGRLRETLAAWAAARGVPFMWERVGTASPARAGLRGLYKALPHPVQAAISLVRHVRTRWPLRRLRSPRWFAGSNAVLIASYFIHLDKAACEAGHFHSRHWEELPRLAHDMGLRVNWLQHYLESATVPSTGLAGEWVSRFNTERETEGCHTFVDSYLSAGVLRRVVLGWWRLRRAERRLGNPAAAFVTPEHQLPLWPLVREEWAGTMRGALAVSNLLWSELFDAALREVPHQPAGLFLLENQSWERAFIDAWRRHGHGRLVGVAHSTVRFWDLRYATHPALVAEGSGLPQPDAIALNGPSAFAAYQSAGYPDSRTVGAEALRYGNLRGLAAATRGARDDTAPLRLLALGDYHAAGTHVTMRMLEAAVPHFTRAVRITVKPHPNFMVRAQDYPGLEFDLVDAPLSEILAEFDVAFASNNTSASVDAFCAGLRVVVALDERELNFSPLRGMAGVSFVSSPSELAAGMLGSTETADLAVARQALFFLGEELPRWRILLGQLTSHGP
jgi:surface carbohydrate biosynthesis protein (TIGR04326 family)